jgi:preprotein translocase subunit SecG
MPYLIGVFIALLVCIFALLYTIKLGNSQGNSKEKYKSSKTTYMNLSYIYGILFILIVIIIFYLVVYAT